jgi:hypothetical protein
VLGSFSMDGRYVATAPHPDAAVKVWEVETGQLALSFGRISSLGLAWQPGGAKVAALTRTRSLR